MTRTPNEQETVSFLQSESAEIKGLSLIEVVDSGKKLRFFMGFLLVGGWRVMEGAGEGHGREKGEVEWGKRKKKVETLMRCNERTIENHEREERSLLNYSPFLLYSTLLLYSLENSVPLSEMKMAENREKEREELLFHPNPCCSVLFCSSFHCSSSCYNFFF